MSDRYAYCKIFVRDIALDGAEDLVAGLFGGVFRRHALAYGRLVMEVRPNSDTSPDQDPGDDFVRWPVTVEVDAEDEQDPKVVVETTSRLLRALWESGHPGVAACDYEPELPWSGGIQRLGG